MILVHGGGKQSTAWMWPLLLFLLGKNAKVRVQGKMHPGQKQLYYSSLQSRHDGANEDNLANAQSRRANVTIVNLPEKSEGDDVFGYIIPGFMGRNTSKQRSS